MSHAYLVGNITVKDAVLWADYTRQVPDTLRPWGAELVFRGKKVAVFSGESPHADIVVIRFPDVAAMNQWFASPAYQSLISLREQAADVVLLGYEAWRASGLAGRRQMLKQRRTVTQALAALALLSLGSCATPIDRSQWVEKTAVVSVSYPCHMMGPDGHFGPGGLPWRDTVKVRLPNDWDSQDVLNRCISESRSNSHRPGFTHMVGECLRRGGYPVEDQAIHFDDKHTC